MSKNNFFVTVLSITLLSGCATHNIQQGKDLSTSGIAYSEAVDKLLEMTADNIIDFDTEELKKSRRGSNPKEMITQKNEAITNILVELNKFRSQTKLLKIYFLNLQAFADSSIKDDVGSVVKSLSDSISKLNKGVDGKDGKESLTEEQKTQIGALGGVVTKTIHATKVKHVLKRDAEIIGVYLALQENQLGNIADILKDRFLTENDLFLNERVIAPFIDIGSKLGANWADDRKQWFKTKFVSQQLATAKEAAKHLRGVWGDILEGKTDINSISVLISDVNEFVTTVQALEEANEEK